jgi:hypothetical protein
MLKEASKKIPLSVNIEEITEEEWQRTPESVKRLIKRLVENIEKRVAELEEENPYLHEKKRT